MYVGECTEALRALRDGWRMLVMGYDFCCFDRCLLAGLPLADAGSWMLLFVILLSMVENA